MTVELSNLTEKLKKLVANFEADKAHDLSKDCSEAQARNAFIKPLFKALGWDIENETGPPHDRRDGRDRDSIPPSGPSVSIHAWEGHQDPERDGDYRLRQW